jgi:hypothetical protein
VGVTLGRILRHAAAFLRAVVASVSSYIWSNSNSQRRARVAACIHDAARVAGGDAEFGVAGRLEGPLIFCDRARGEWGPHYAAFLSHGGEVKGGDVGGSR